ncbi:MAG: S41 family peptidase [Bacillota bacterium]
MRSPISRSTAILIAGILLLCVCASCSVTADPGELADYSPDARQAEAEIEAAHPVFLMDEIPEDYEVAKAEYLDSVASPMKRVDFLLATQKYLAALRDGHMGGGLSHSGQYILVRWVSIDDRLYLMDEKGQVTGDEVIQIGNVPVKDVQAQVDAYYYAENDSARQRQYGAYCRQDDMLRLAGCQFEDTIEVVTRDSSGVEKKQACRFSPGDIGIMYYGGSPTYVVKHEMLGDVFYVDLRTFREGSEVTNTAKAIRRARGEGTTKFIIDVRGNSGGNSMVGEQLLAAMGMKPPSYGCYICSSELSRKLRGPASQKVAYFEPDPSTAKKNDDIELVVLTDRITFSSATMLGVWVQDGDLGIIVGQPSSNAPTAYGDMLRVRLPISDINLQISYKKFLRPDVNADQDTLQPDILTEFGEDALEVALEYLAGK